MLFPKRVWVGLVDGSVTVAFRYWKRPTVKGGGTLQSAVGVLAIDSVDRIAIRDSTTLPIQQIFTRVAIGEFTSECIYFFVITQTSWL